MEKSLFSQYVKKIWPKLSLWVKEKENNGKPRTYLHKQLLTNVYSADNKWEGTSANTTYVAADVVALDSPIPLKKRDAIASTGGKIPKVGMKKKLTETDMTNIHIMESHLNAGGTAAASAKKRIFEKFLNDGEAVSIGIDERNELNFLSGLYNGVILVDDDENTGTGIRVVYGYPEANTFSTAVKDVVEFEDIENVFTQADAEGKTIEAVAISKKFYNDLRKTRWARQLVADAKDQTYTEATSLPVPSPEAFDSAFEAEFGASFIKIDRTVIIEKNGIRKAIKPFGNDKMVFLPDANHVGSLCYGQLAEVSHPVNGVDYTTVDDFKLISKYSTNEPSLAEFTKGEAIVCPVIEDVENIFILDKTLSEEVNTTEENKDTADQYITIAGVTYEKPSAISVLKQLGANVRVNSSDAVVIEAYNTLSGEAKAVFAETANVKH